MEYILIEPSQPLSENVQRSDKQQDPLGLASPNPHMLKLLKCLERISERAEVIESKLKAQQTSPAP